MMYTATGRLRCPSCLAEGFYDGFLEKQCWRTGCRWFHPRALELREADLQKQMGRFVLDDTQPGVKVR